MTTITEVLSGAANAVQAAEHRFEVCVAGERIGVRATERDARALCEHVFGRQGRVEQLSPGDSPAWTVAALASNELHASSLAAARDAATDERQPALAAYWRDDHQARRLVSSPRLTICEHTEPFCALTLMVPAERLVLYVRLRTEPFYLPHFEHLIAYVARTGCWQRGMLDVHGSFVSYRGRGLILSGPKGAGKTTLAMHLLGRRGSLLASDMGELRPVTGARPHAVVVPHICRIARETIGDNRTLAQSVGSRFDGNDRFLAGPVFAEGKFGMYPPVLDHLFDRRLHLRSMAIDAAVFPKFDLRLERQRAVRLAPEEGRRRLLASIKTDRPAADWLPFEAVLAREVIEKAALTEVADCRLEALELGFGREPSLDWNEIDDLVDSLQSHGATAR